MIRYWIKKYRDLKRNPPPPHVTQKWLNIMRCAYFASACGLLFVVVRGYMRAAVRAKEENSKNKEKEEYDDISEAHKNLRESNVDHGFIYAFTTRDGLVREEFHRDLYLQELEKRAKLKSLEARKAAEIEGRKFAQDASKVSSQ